MEAAGQGWGAARDPSGHQRCCQPNIKAVARRYIPHPQLLQVGPGSWARSGSQREKKLLDSPVHRFPRCASPPGGGRASGKQLGDALGYSAPLSDATERAVRCPSQRGTQGGGTAEGRGSREMRRVPAAPSAGSRVAAFSLAADFKTNILCAPAPRKGKCGEEKVIALNIYEANGPYAIAEERNARVGGREEKDQESVGRSPPPAAAKCSTSSPQLAAPTLLLLLLKRSTAAPILLLLLLKRSTAAPTLFLLLLKRSTETCSHICGNAFTQQGLDYGHTEKFASVIVLPKML
ncbi:uncharacterized protein LOC135175037 [Pogoniulus pusillus]|uniref:uncharacterized protein LOC135175037 n=1 Tax=Pogoniulus pusillus TaxID=488313 RepID=UPI0030B96749